MNTKKIEGRIAAALAHVEQLASSTSKNGETVAVVRALARAVTMRLAQFDHESQTRNGVSYQQAITEEGRAIDQLEGS